MTDFSVPAREPSVSNSLIWGFFATVGILALGMVVILPLPWKQQAILGAGLIVVAILLGWASRARVVTIALMAISVSCTLRYGYFRVTQSWNGITSGGHLHQWDTFFVLLLLLAEFYAFLTLVLGYFQTLRPLQRPPVGLAGTPQDWPSVDVFIPTYNESLSIVRATVLGALSLDYPPDKFKVFVLDDGHREEFADFARRVGAGYISRSNNAHAKAGNINHALQLTTGEYVAIFDSDHIPTRSFLQATLGWFQRDRRLAMVQTPHHFYSADPFERNLEQFRKIPNEGELFHRLVQDGNDLWNASFFCGSCAVLRRTALRQIGGIAVETVTEDAHTALRMQKRGWSTAYINLPQAAGLATESLAAHIGQRIRWARGMIQVLRIENPLFTRGLSFSQRVCYFNATTHFLFAIPRLIFLLIPLVYLLFGVVNIYGYSLAVFAFALPHIVLSNITNARIQGRYRFSFWNEIYEAVLAPYILFPTLLALINPRLGKFNVTSKGGTISRSYFDRRIALPLLFLLSLNVAGLVVAERRFAADRLHRDTVIMNAVWTAYNCMILCVAASVAWEKRQRRSEVRVNLRVPLTLSTPSGQKMAGITTELSGRGAMVRLARPLELGRGTPVVVSLEGNRSPCEIAARVMGSRRRHLHLFFPRRSLAQERYLVNVMYSRPEAWMGWNRTRPVDRPLLTLARIVLLACRGAGLILFGFFFSRRSTDDDSTQLNQRLRRVSALVPGVAWLALFLLSPGRVHALDAGTNHAGASQAQLQARGPLVPSPGFHDQYDLGTLAERRWIALTTAGSSQNFFLDMPLTKIITSATLDLRYNAPLLRAGESSILLWLNGTKVGSVPLAPGKQQAELPLPTDLLTTQNTLTIQLQGACAACKNNGSPWVTFDPASQLNLSGARLPLANDLALLPVPFFDSASQHAWTLPVVFADRPSAEALEAASAVTSWFGIFSDFRGVRFPVTIGELPAGNAVVLVLRSSELFSRLSLPAKPGALIAVRENPRDPYGKLLILAGEKPSDLLTAARALVTRNNAQAHTDTVNVSSANISLVRAQTAPRWLDTRKPASIGTYTTAERLKLKGSGSIYLYFRIPPDLFLAARQSVPLLLKFSYGGVTSQRAALHIRLNDRDIDSLPLRASDSSVSREELFRLPTDRLRPYTNTLSVDFDLGSEALPVTKSQFAAIGRDSSLDLSGLPHSVVLPRLELFADSGYPFTASPDLARTAVVLPEAPTEADYETLLGLMGFFGAQTGTPVMRITITNAGGVEQARDNDLILLGTPTTQPLLKAWADDMPLALGDDLRLNNQPAPSPLLHPEWPFRNADRSRLAALLASRTPLDVVVEAFVSPLLPDRTVVAIVPRGAGSLDAIASMLTPALEKGPIYGAVAVAQSGRFQSFLVGTAAYHSGHLDPVEQSRIWLSEHYFFLPLVVMLLAFPIAGWLYSVTERVAARRLAGWEKSNVRLAS
jgi:cellulose synthase (UDP-forming)/cellulose synthase operon protein B